MEDKGIKGHALAWDGEKESPYTVVTRLGMQSHVGRLNNHGNSVNQIMTLL